jgi:hypothetical protein
MLHSRQLQAPAHTKYINSTSLYQAVEAHRIVRPRGLHIFLDNRLTEGRQRLAPRRMPGTHICYRLSRRRVTCQDIRAIPKRNKHSSSNICFIFLEVLATWFKLYYMHSLWYKMPHLDTAFFWPGLVLLYMYTVIRKQKHPFHVENYIHIILFLKKLTTLNTTFCPWRHRSGNFTEQTRQG